MDERKITFQLEEGRSLNISLCFNVWFLVSLLLSFKALEETIGFRGRLETFWACLWIVHVWIQKVGFEPIPECRVVNCGKPWVWEEAWVSVLPLIFSFPSLRLSFLICKWRFRWLEGPQSVAILECCHPFDPSHSILSGRNWLFWKQQLSFFFFVSLLKKKARCA